MKNSNAITAVLRRIRGLKGAVISDTSIETTRSNNRILLHGVWEIGDGELKKEDISEGEKSALKGGRDENFPERM